MIRKLQVSMVLLSGVLGAYASDCPALIKGKQEEIGRYLQKRYALPPDDQLTVTEDGVIDGTCYRKFIVEAPSQKRRLTVILSPDQRYLVPVLLDLTIDPEIEAQEMRSRIQQLLTADRSPSKGRSDAPITIVEFSDFQCPFCRRMASFLDSLPDAEKGKERYESSTS
jgi:hypothetical protein